MRETKDIEKKWWLKGVLFENCNCQIICPAHVSMNGGPYCLHADGKSDR